MTFVLYLQSGQAHTACMLQFCHVTLQVTHAPYDRLASSAGVGQWRTTCTPACMWPAGVRYHWHNAPQRYPLHNTTMTYDGLEKVERCRGMHWQQGAQPGKRPTNSHTDKPNNSHTDTDATNACGCVPSMLGVCDDTRQVLIHVH